MSRHPNPLLPDDGLDAALRLFWRQGYFDTSMDHLVTASGLNRKAIYAAYGGKQALFEAMLLRYREQVMAPALAPLREPEASLPALERFWHQFAGRADGPESRLGCLMVNAATEVAPHVRPVARIVRTYLDDVRALFRAAVVRAAARGQLRQDADPDALADYLVGALLGLMTMARAPVPRDALVRYVHGVLASLRSQTVHGNS